MDAKKLDAKAYSQSAVPFEVLPTLVDTEPRLPSGKDDKARSEFSEMKIQVVRSRWQWLNVRAVCCPGRKAGDLHSHAKLTRKACYTTSNSDIRT